MIYPLTTRGERFPFASTGARGFELEEPRDKVDRYRAILEGVAFVERLCFAYLESLGASVSGPVSLTGGGARSRVCSQLRADVLGLPVFVPHSSEPAVGMAILALAGTGSVAATASRMSHAELRFEPDKASRERLAENSTASRQPSSSGATSPKISPSGREFLHECFAVRLPLARHGQTEWHHDNRYVSRTDIGLNDAGRHEARALARRAGEERPALVLCSPLARAFETARLAAEACGAELRADDRLREVDFGEWEGRTLEEMRTVDPKAVKRFETDPGERPFPRGEPLPNATSRALEAYQELRRSHGSQTVLVVAHNTLLRLTLCALLRIPLNHYRRRFPRLLNVAISEVRLGADGGALYTLNDSRHLAA